MDSLSAEQAGSYLSTKTFTQFTKSKQINFAIRSALSPFSSHHNFAYQTPFNPILAYLDYKLGINGQKSAIEY